MVDSLLNILFKKDPGRRVQIGSIILDATLEEDHEYTSTVTEHPIEEGGFATDHAYENPRVLTIRGHITDTPVTFFSILNGISSRRIEAKDQLVELYKAREPITVVTGLEIYDDVILESLKFPRNVTTGKKLEFIATFREIRFVESKIVGIAEKRAAPDIKDKISGNKDVGRNELLDPNESQNAIFGKKVETLSIVSG